MDEPKQYPRDGYFVSTMTKHTDPIGVEDYEFELGSGRPGEVDFKVWTTWSDLVQPLINAFEEGSLVAAPEIVRGKLFVKDCRPYPLRGS